MLRRIALILILAAGLILAGCSDDTATQIDKGPSPDGPVKKDGGGDAGPDRGADLAPADGSPEASPGDMAVEVRPHDGNPMDKAIPDLPVPDLPLPDLPVPDLPLPDLPLPDLPPPADMASAVDMPPAADLPPVADMGPPGEGGTPAGPSTINAGEAASGVSCQFSRSLVQNASGHLFYCYRDGVAPFDLNISRSINGGATWSVWAKKVSTEASPKYNISGCNMAVDGNGGIYAVWHRYSYSPAFHATYIRKYDPNAGAWGTQATVKETALKCSSSAVAVDSKNYVYVVAGGTSSWHTHLYKSTTPGGTTFTSLGDPKVSSYSQTGVLTIDSKDNPHMLFYDVSSSTGVIMHRWYSGGWKTSTIVSTAVPNNDKPGPMAADSLGNVHMLYVDNGADGTKTQTFWYRRWDASTSKVGAAVKLWDHTTTQSGSAAIVNAYTVNLGVNEATGDVYVVGRDMNRGGAFVLLKKTLTASTFSLVKKLRPDSTTNHMYYMPRVRGTVYPSFNQTKTTLDVSWIEDASNATGRSSKFLRVALP